MCPSRKASPSVHLGVDFLRLGRIQKFFKAHGPEVFQKILTDRELELLRRRRKMKPSEIARRFAAKEAYFKTLNQPWLGVEGFQRIHIEPTTPHAFRAGWVTDSGAITDWAEGCFYTGKKWIAAQAVRWASKNSKINFSRSLRLSRKNSDALAAA